MDKPLENKDLLLSKILTLENELDVKKQRIHELKSKLLLSAALEEDYLLEIEALQSSSKVAQLKNTLKHLEERHLNRRHINTNSEIKKKIEHIETLKGQIEELKLNNNSTKDNYIEKKKVQENNEFVLNQNLSLKHEIETLEVDLYNVKISVEDLKKQNDEMETQKTIYTKDLQEAKEALQDKLQRLQETKEHVNRLQEEVSTKKLDLNAIKCKPLDSEKRGNSLFAEVDDSRVKMQQQIAQLTQRYETMKRDLQQKLQLKSVLRTQVIKLSNEVNQMENHSDDNETIIDSYRAKIKNMERNIEQYKKEVLQEIKLIGKNLPNYVVEFANCRIKSIWHELATSRDELNHFSKQMLEVCLELVANNKEKLQHTIQVLQLKVKIEELENMILEIQLQNNPMESKKFVDIPFLQELNVHARCSILSFENHLRPSIIPTDDFSVLPKNCKKVLHLQSLDTPSIQEEQTHSKSISDGKTIDLCESYTSQSTTNQDTASSRLKPILFPSEEHGWTNPCSSPILQLTSKQTGSNSYLEHTLHPSSEEHIEKLNKDHSDISYELHLPSGTSDKQSDIKKWIENVNTAENSEMTNVTLLVNNTQNSTIEETATALNNFSDEDNVDSWIAHHTKIAHKKALLSCSYNEMTNTSIHHTHKNACKTTLTSCIIDEPTISDLCTKSDMQNTSPITTALPQNNLASFSSEKGIQMLPKNLFLQKTFNESQEAISSNEIMSLDGAKDFGDVCLLFKQITLEESNNTASKSQKENIENVSVQTISSAITEKELEMSSTSSLNTQTTENALKDAPNLVSEPECDTVYGSGGETLPEVQFPKENLQDVPVSTCEDSVKETEMLLVQPLETTITNDMYKAVETETLQNKSLNSDIEIEDINVSCITIDSSSSDNVEIIEENLGVEKVEPDESIAVQSFPHRDSFMIESKWKESRKITSLSIELQTAKQNNKENPRPASYNTPANQKHHPAIQTATRIPLSERNTTVKRGIIKPASIEKRWRY